MGISNEYVFTIWQIELRPIHLTQMSWISQFLAEEFKILWFSVFVTCRCLQVVFVLSRTKVAQRHWIKPVEWLSSIFLKSASGKKKYGKRVSTIWYIRIQYTVTWRLLYIFFHHTWICLFYWKQTTESVTEFLRRYVWSLIKEYRRRGLWTLTTEHIFIDSQLQILWIILNIEKDFEYDY